MRHSPPVRNALATRGMLSGWTNRRLVWRALGQGSGNKRNSWSRQACGKSRRISLASSFQIRRFAGSGRRSPAHSGIRADSSEQMPFSYTSQAISPACGLADAWARACSPPPKPTSSHKALISVSNTVPGSANCERDNSSFGSVDDRSSSCRGRSLLPRVRPYNRSAAGFSLADDSLTPSELAFSD